MSEQRHDDNFDRLVAELQQEVSEQERAIYSEKVIQEVNHPRNVGRMPEPDAHAIIRGWCGDTMEIYLQLEGQRIEHASFVTDGCGPSVACGSMLTAIVTEMSVEQAGSVQPEELIDALDGLPEDSLHCAELAVKTLRQALASYAGTQAPSH
jgi:nitrogen fixation NifU-like protein